MIDNFVSRLNSYHVFYSKQKQCKLTLIISYTLFTSVLKLDYDFYFEKS